MFFGFTFISVFLFQYIYLNLLIDLSNKYIVADIGVVYMLFYSEFTISKLILYRPHFTSTKFF